MKEIIKNILEKTWHILYMWYFFVDIRINIIKYCLVYILLIKKMKIISKIICGIFVVIILFILVNLINWTVWYWWTKNYAEILNNKDRNESVSQISILKPKTWISIFYDSQVEENVDLEGIVDDFNLEEDMGVEFESWDVEEEEKEVNHNPYDPDYEDEFNSFFWITSEETWWDIIPVQEIEDLEPAGFVADESAED